MVIGIDGIILRAVHLIDDPLSASHNGRAGATIHCTAVVRGLNQGLL
jgi:hypothetical protein